MKFYIFSEGFGVMAESEDAARRAVREQWSMDTAASPECCGDPEQFAASELLMAVGPDVLVSFFC